MDTLLSYIRIIHIAAGATSLLTGIIALSIASNPQRHRKIGKVFFYGMFVVFITALIMGLNGSLMFLLCIAVLSFFSTFHGVRSLQFFKGQNPNWIDWLSSVALSLAGAYLFIKGTLASITNFSSGVILYIVFGALMLVLSFGAFRRLRKLKPRDFKWFRSHRANMGAALIATMTAFSVTALQFLPPLVSWLWPTIIFAPLLSLMIRRTDKQLGMRK